MSRSLRMLVLVTAILTLGADIATPPQLPFLLPAPFNRPSPPHEIKIRGIIFTVTFISENSKLLQGKYVGFTCDEEMVKEGRCADLYTIFLATDKPIEQERETLIHEIEHGMVGSDRSEEEITYHDAITELAPRFLQVIQDNPKLLAYLTKKVTVGM